MKKKIPKFTEEELEKRIRETLQKMIETSIPQTKELIPKIEKRMRDRRSELLN